jgi:hypothetical protein
MQDVYLTSTRDTVLVAVPFIVLVGMVIFGLDAFFVPSKGPAAPANRHRPGCGLDETGEPVLVDPDGRPSEFRSSRK